MRSVVEVSFVSARFRDGFSLDRFLEDEELRCGTLPEPCQTCGFRHNGGPHLAPREVAPGVSGEDRIQKWGAQRRTAQRGALKLAAFRLERLSTQGKSSRTRRSDTLASFGESPRLLICPQCRRWRSVKAGTLLKGWRCGQCRGKPAGFRPAIARLR